MRLAWDNVAPSILKSGYCPYILVEICEILWLAKQLHSFYPPANTPNLYLYSDFLKPID